MLQAATVLYLLVTFSELLKGLNGPSDQQFVLVPDGHCKTCDDSIWRQYDSTVLRSSKIDYLIFGAEDRNP